MGNAGELASDVGGRPLAAVVGAIRRRWQVGRGSGGAAIVMALRGGQGAFLTGAACRRLVTTATASEAVSASGGLVGWLEKRQARRSAILAVPDRPSGVAIALRWRISPERLRLASELEAQPSESVHPADPARPWHVGK